MDSPQPSPSAGKIRLLCSFGGRIVPRPHDKALCYAGGETRLIAVDRRTAASSFSSLTSHISRSLLNGRPFCLKYQLPEHDLDSLVSVATDEDLSNMFEEYDRASLSSNPSRLRFFLFPAAKPDPSLAGDYDPRSEAWFFDALRSAGIAVDGKRSSESGSGEGLVDCEAKSGGVIDSSAVSADSVFLETSSSLGSTKSATSAVANLPAIKFGHVEEVGCVHGHDFKPNQSLESDSSITSPNFQSPTLVYLDSFSQSDPKDSKFFTNSMETDISSPDISPRIDQLNAMQAYGYSLSQAIDQMQQQPSTPQIPTQAQLQPQPQPTLQGYSQLQPQYIHAGPQYVAQYYSSGVPTASYPTSYQPYLQQQQQQQQQHAGYQLNKSYPVYLMHVGQPQAQCDMTTAASIPSSHPQLLSNPPMMVTSPVVYDGFGTPKSSEITAKVYRPGPTASQPVSVQSDVAQMSQPQPVSAPSQCDMTTAASIPSSHPQLLSNPPMMVTSPVVYDGFGTPKSSEITAKVYRPGPTASQPVSVQSDVAQMSQPQPVSAPSVVDGANYGGTAEFEDSLHAQIYKTQPTLPAIASQRQPTTSAATAMLLDNLTQLQLDTAM